MQLLFGAERTLILPTERNTDPDRGDSNPISNPEPIPNPGGRL